MKVQSENPTIDRGNSISTMCINDLTSCFGLSGVSEHYILASLHSTYYQSEKAISAFIMKLYYTPFFSILWATETFALPADPAGIESFSPLPDPNAIFKRAPRDCGTFKFKCKNMAGACNNACYYINCVNKGNANFAWGSSPVDNRVHSGCTFTTKASICKLKPFSQRFWDRQLDDVAPKPLQCDEFPMNAFKQTEFQEGTVRNSLRCINGGQNGSMLFLDILVVASVLTDTRWRFAIWSVQASNWRLEERREISCN